MAAIHLSQYQANPLIFTRNAKLDISSDFVSNYQMDEVLNKKLFLPAHSMFLGLAGIDQPILFDWKDPKPHSLLIIDDKTESIRRLMLTMIRSLTLTTKPEDIQYISISDNPDKWMELISEFDQNYEFCAGVVGSNEISAEDWIIYLAQKTEKRLEGKQWGATIILLVEDNSIIDNFDIQTRLNFEWLIKYGAKVNIWTISGLNIQNTKGSIPMSEIYRSKIFGRIDPMFFEKMKNIVPVSVLNELQSDQQFVTKIGSEWIRFWAPKLQC